MRGRAWSDDEIGFLQDHADWSAPQIAEVLGRTPKAIRDARRLAASGRLGAQVRSPWTDAEDAILIDRGLWVTAEALVQVLPGRSIHSIYRRRQALGLAVDRGHRAFDVCGRPLVAKTCLGCDLLLAGAWFSFQKSQNGWSSYCRRCNAQKAAESKARGSGMQTAAMSKAYRDRMQRLTLPRAKRHGEAYTSADFEVLGDPMLTDLQKALRLQRTYAAVGATRRAAGLKSRPDGLGDPKRDTWVIDSPNHSLMEVA